MHPGAEEKQRGVEESASCSGEGEVAQAGRGYACSAAIVVVQVCLNVKMMRERDEKSRWMVQIRKDEWLRLG